MRLRQNDPTAAVTLLEMLVATAIIAVIAGSLYASLQLGFRARDHAEARLETVRAAGIALDILGRDLTCAPPPRGILAGPFIGSPVRTSALGAAADMLAFYTREVNTTEAAPGIVRVEYAISQPADEDAPALVRRMTVNLLAPQTPTPLEEVLCRNVISFSLRYFDGTTWVDAWDSTTQDNSLPIAVEVALELRRQRGGGNGETNLRFTRIFAPPCAALPTSDATSLLIGVLP